MAALRCWLLLTAELSWSKRVSLAPLTRLPGDGTCNSWATPWETQALPERAICTGRKLKNKKVRVKLEKEENSRKVVRKAKNAFLEQPQRCAEAKYVSFAPNSQFEWAIDLKARAASAATSSGWEPGSLHQQLRAACVQPEREKKKKPDSKSCLAAALTSAC